MRNERRSRRSKSYKQNKDKQKQIIQPQRTNTKTIERIFTARIAKEAKVAKRAQNY